MKKRLQMAVILAILLAVISMSAGVLCQETDRRVRFEVTDSKTNTAIQGAVIRIFKGTTNVQNLTTDVNGEAETNVDDNTAYSYSVSATCHRTIDGSFNSGSGTTVLIIPVKLVPISCGGIVISVDKFGLLAPYIGLTSTILAATVATATYVKRVKHRKEKQ